MTEIDCQIWFFQEVGGLGKCSWLPVTGSLRVLQDDFEGPWHGYHVFGGSPLDSHLGQVIAVDADIFSHVVDSVIASRCILLRVRLTHSANDFCVLSCHLPHKDNPATSFSDAVAELEGLLRTYRHLPTVIAGDFNAQLGDDRCLELSSILSSLGYTCRQSGVPTRHGRHSHSEYDFSLRTLGNAAFYTLTVTSICRHMDVLPRRSPVTMTS